MSKIFLIDSENIGHYWEYLTINLDSWDKIYVFYTDRSPGLSIANFDLLKKYINNIEFIYCNSCKNALDFQLASYLGYLIHSNPSEEYIVVSNDSGFYPLVEFWGEKGYKISTLKRKEVVDGIGDNITKLSKPALKLLKSSSVYSALPPSLRDMEESMVGIPIVDDDDLIDPELIDADMLVRKTEGSPVEVLSSDVSVKADYEDHTSELYEIDREAIKYYCPEHKQRGTIIDVASVVCSGTSPEETDEHRGMFRMYEWGDWAYECFKDHLFRIYRGYETSEVSNKYKRTAEMLVVAREKHGWTTEQVASITKLYYKHLVKVEDGEAKPNEYEIHKLSLLYSIAEDEIVESIKLDELYFV